MSSVDEFAMSSVFSSTYFFSCRSSFWCCFWFYFNVCF